MDINQLVYFISVAQTLNFSEAARRNYVSQSTVSRYVSELEKELGVQLFARSRRDVVITNEGKTFLPYAIETVDTINKAKRVIAQMQNGGKGKLSIGCDVTSLSFPSRCISDFNKKYSGITIDLSQLDVTDRHQALTDGEFDFCFMPRDMVPESSGIETLSTHSEPLVVVASKNGRFKEKTSISFSDIANERLLLLSENLAPILYMEVMDLLRTFHISPKVETSYNDLMSMYVAVTAELGVAVIPKSLAEYTSSTHTKILSIKDTDTSVAYVVAWSKSISNPVARLFIETVQKYSVDDDDVYGL